MSRLDLDRYDLQGMHRVYDRWPEMASDAYGADVVPVQYDDIDHIVFAGMGGSGALGDIFASILSKTSLHTSIVKGYLLPATADRNTLVVATSISGNTAEPLSVLRAAKEAGCPAVAFSSGGRIKEYCADSDIQYRQIPQTHSPRASFPIFLYSMLAVLESIVPVSREDIAESISVMRDTARSISSENTGDGNPACDLAGWIGGMPVIYYPWGLRAAAIRFKNSLQENAKMHAATEDILEACHNDIVAWDRKSDAQPILLQGRDDYVKTKERWRIVEEYFESNGIPYRVVGTSGSSILSKLISMIYLLDYATIYLAVMCGVDPSPVSSIDFVKDRLQTGTV